MVSAFTWRKHALSLFWIQYWGISPVDPSSFKSQPQWQPNRTGRLVSNSSHLVIISAATNAMAATVVGEGWRTTTAAAAAGGGLHSSISAGGWWPPQWRTEQIHHRQYILFYPHRLMIAFRLALLLLLCSRLPSIQVEWRSRKDLLYWIWTPINSTLFSTVFSGSRLFLLKHISWKK